MVSSQRYPFGTRLLFTNPSPQPLITCTWEVLFARGGFPCLLCCLMLSKALISLFWPSISHQSITEIHIPEWFPAPTTYRSIDIGHISAVSRKLSFPWSWSYSFFLGLTLSTALPWATLEKNHPEGLWRKAPILECHFEHLVDSKFFIPHPVWSQWPG